MSAVETSVVCTCGKTHPPGVDFCSCGRYIAWSDSVVSADETRVAARPESSEEAADPAEQPDVVLTIAKTGMAVVEDMPLAFSLAAGSATELTATIRNVGRAVGAFTLSVRGEPAAEWATISETVIRLLPVGPHGNYERKVKLVVRPPRSSAAPAGVHKLTVAVSSAARAHEQTLVDVYIDVQPFFDLTLEASPALAVGRRRATVLCTLGNRGNRTITPELKLADADGRCQIEIPEIGPIEPGASRDVPVVVSARRPLFGRPVDHQLRVVAKLPELPDPAPPRSVIFRQRPLIPWWVPVALAMLVALAIALVALLLSRPRMVVTPALRGARDAYQAQQTLEAAGFKTPPIVTTVVVAGTASGTVLDQTPAAGTKVAESTIVTLRVAVPPAGAIVPDLTDLTTVAADATLYDDHLKLGAVLPQPDPTRLIVSQIPSAGVMRPRGTAITVVLAGPGKVAVPKLHCLIVQNAEKRLTNRGLKLGTLPNFANAMSHVLTQVPAAGAKRAPGTTVTVSVAQATSVACAKKKPATGGTSAGGATGSAAAGTAAAGASGTGLDRGLTGLVFDDGTRIRSAARSTPGVTGRAPAFSADGRWLAVEQGTGIALRDLRSSDLASPLPQTPAVTLTAPAFAPVVLTEVLAFVKLRAGAADQVCLVDVTAARPVPDCLALDGVTPRALSWTADARDLLIVTGDSRPSGLSVAATGSPGSAHWSDYTAPAGVHPRAAGVEGDVLAAAGVPGSSTVALITDLSAAGQRTRPQVVLVDEDRLGRLDGASWLGVAACQLAFDPSGAQVAVVGVGPAGCRGDGAPGVISVASMQAPRVSRVVARDGTSPAWRPRA